MEKMSEISISRTAWELKVRKIAAFLREGCQKKDAVVGLSGGLDSAVVAKLATMALGPERVHALIMPDSEVTDPADFEDAKALAEKLEAMVTVQPITEIKKAFLNANAIRSDPLSIGNTCARIRMTILYAYANTCNAMVLGTSDKSELELGFFTKWGDGGADILPIADLYKTEVRALARYLELPTRIVTKPSSPNLQVGQTAEDEIGMTYEEIDLMLSGKKPMSRALLKRYYGNAHKRERIPICKLDKY